jgi:hypothetical protein
MIRENGSSTAVLAVLRSASTASSTHVRSLLILKALQLQSCCGDRLLLVELN